MKKLLLLLLLCLCAIPHTMAYTVYFDASGTGVAQPYVYMWLNNNVNTNIVKMNPVDGTDNLFSYTWDKTPVGLIFLKDSSWEDSNKNSNKLTGDVTTNINDGCVYSGGNYKGMYEDLYGGQNDSRLVWYTPEDATMYDEITVYYNANNGNAPFKENKGAKQLYIYPGADTSHKNADDTGWQYTKWASDTEFPQDCRMSYDSESDTYSITFKPFRFFEMANVPSSDYRMTKLYASFRIEGEATVGGDTDGVPVAVEFGAPIITPDPETPDRTVYFKNEWGGDVVYAYIYYKQGEKETQLSGKWPGNQMSLESDDWYSVYIAGTNIPSDATTHIIFTRNDGDDSHRYPANEQPGITVDFTSPEGWYRLDDKIWYAENPEGNFTNNYLGYEFIDGTTVKVKTTSKNIFITPYGNDIIKVFTLPANPASGFVTEERESITVLPSAAPAPNSVITEASIDDDENSTELLINAGGTVVRVSKTNGQLSFVNADGKVMLTERGGLNNSGATSRSCSFAGMGEDGLYGGGYYGQLNQDGKPLVMNNRQTGTWPEDQGHSYTHNICIPFYVSTAGYGVLFDDHYNNSSMSLSSSNGTSYTTGSRNPIAYYYFGGDSMGKVLENYTMITGRQELPPYWMLGYITSRYGYRSQDEGLDAVYRIKGMDIPLDAIVFDIYWQGRNGSIPSYMGKLDWDTGNFPNPTEMISKLKSDNVNTILITEPFFTSSSGNYEYLNDNGLFAHSRIENMGWLGSDPVGLIDITKKAALDWFAKCYKKHTGTGVAGWWLDLGEPEQHNSDTSYEKGTRDQVHNEYGQRWIELVYNTLKENYPNQRHVVMPRSGTAGMQRYSTFPWTGDINRSWTGLTVQIPALLTSGMSGVAYMGCDVGGFMNPTRNDALYMRWVQSAVFSPAMRTHANIPGAKLDCDGGPEPFNYKNNPTLVNNVRDMINKRYKFLPYTYTLAYENATKGWPLARPSNFYMPTEGDLASCDTQYLWGKDLLVAPVTEQNATTKTVIFPEGKWMNLNDYSKVYGSQSMTARENVAAPADVLPHFARLGSVIPCYTEDTFTSTEGIDRSKMTLMYFYDEENPAVSSYYYDDDHKSPTSIADGNYCITRMEANEASTSRWLTISYEGKPDEILPEEMTYTIIIPKYGNHVSAEGLCVIRKSDSQQSARGIRASRPQEKVTMASTKNEFDNTTENVAYRDGTDLYIKVQRRRGDTMVQPHFNETTTSIDDIEAVADRLSICAMGTADDLTLRYYVPVDGISAEVSLVAASGMTVASMANAEADKGAHLLNVGGVTPGIYVAHVKVATANGSSISTSEKIIVR